MFMTLLAMTSIVAEILGASILYHRHRSKLAEFLGYSPSVILYTIQKAIDLSKPPYERDKRQIKVVPSPLYVPDKAEGYVMKPGKYKVSIYKADYPSSKPYSYKATILEDGSRYVGAARIPKASDTQHVFVYGDSFIFGEGVNDEQTFSYLLQQKYAEKHVRLHAIGGGSLTNAYVDFQRNKHRLNENDVVILGFAQYYLLRNVAGPSRLRIYGKKQKHYSPNLKHLKADVDSSGNLAISTVPLFCEDAGGYCDQKDPDRNYQNKVAAKLIDEIARGSRAKVLLLFIREYEKPEPVLKMINPSVIELVSCLENDFEDMVHDQIMDYDPHPGPFWHYAIYTRLDERLSKWQAGKKSE
jgi:hypothetical protein